MLTLCPCNNISIVLFLLSQALQAFVELAETEPLFLRQHLDLVVQVSDFVFLLQSHKALLTYILGFVLWGVAAYI